MKNTKVKISIGSLFKMDTRHLAHAGLLVAVSIILARLGGVEVMRIIRLSFGNIPIYMGGLFFGPLIGGMIGAIADILGYLINSFGSPYAPQILLASIMRGIIPPLVVTLLGMNRCNWFLKVFFAIIGAEIVSGIFLTTWGLSWLFGTPFMTLLLPRLIALSVQVPVYTVVTYMLTYRLRDYVQQAVLSKP